MKGPKPLTIVIKLGEPSQKYLQTFVADSFPGTSSIVDEKTHEPLISILSLICETAVKLHKDGHKVIIVSSGAIGVGLRRMNIEKRPKHLPRIQVRSIGTPCYMSDLIGCLGSCSDRSMSTHWRLGHALWPSSTTHCSNSAHKK